MRTALLLLDQKNFVIYGFIPSARANQLCDSLRTSAIVDRFEVGCCSNLYYKITDHSFVILSSPPPPLMKSLPLALSSTFRRSCSGNVVRLIRSYDPSDLSNVTATTRVSYGNNKSPVMNGQSGQPTASGGAPGKELKLMTQICQAGQTKRRAANAHVSDCFQSNKPSSPL
uniref:Uncharacterized protein n=1 Tax=Brassica campestris TaxID=3711 RepID=M4CSF5_BRACM